MFVGSFIKICKVCEGLVDEYFCFVFIMEWDMVVGYVIVKVFGVEIY